MAYTQQDVQNLIQSTGMDPTQISQLAFGNPNFSGPWTQDPNKEYEILSQHINTDPVFQMAIERQKQNSAIQNSLAPIQQFFKMLMSPVDPNDPTWGPYIKAITNTARANAGTSAANAGIQGPLADQGTQAATTGALANFGMQRMGLASQVGGQALGGQMGLSEFSTQGLYNQLAQKQAQDASNNPLNIISSIFSGAGNLAGGVGGLAKGFGLGGGGAGLASTAAAAV